MKIVERESERDAAILLHPSFFSPTQPSVDQLQTQFNAYEQSKEQVEHVLRHWDRTLLMLLVPVPLEESPTVSEETVSEKRVSAGCLTY